MTFSRLITFAVLTCSVSQAFASESLAFNEAEKCRNVSDSNAVPAFVPSFWQEAMHHWGFAPPGWSPALPQDSGKCVDQEGFRPVRLLSAEGSEPFAGYDPSVYQFVANVRHNDGWYYAAIPVHAAAKAIFQISIRDMSVLGVRGGHAEMRILFNDPVVLVPQVPLRADKPLTTLELVFTANAVGANGGARTDAMRNFDGSLLHALGVQTRESRLQQSYVDSYQKTQKQLALNLTSREIIDYMNLYIKQAHDFRLTRRFILTGLNCTTAQFEVLDQVLHSRYSGKQRVPFDPDNAKKRLQERGLLDSTVVMPPLEEEPWAVEYFKTHGRHAPE